MIADVIDLFCGVGGLSLGFRDEGFRVLAGYDIDSTCRHAYETNIGAKFIQNDVANVSADELIPLFSKERRSVLVGCAPCQPFSLYTGRYRQNETEADVGRRWEMLDEFSRLIEAASQALDTTSPTSGLEHKITASPRSALDLSSLPPSWAN
jgi:DNA (cytosine-5)-methyltransferase 1